jgi:FkbM family methyltransferase
MLDDYCRYYEMQQNDLIIDLGAAVGDFGKSILHKIKQKNAFLVCVEPALWTVNVLSDWINKQLTPNGMLLSTAVWKENGTQKMEITNSYLLNNIAETQHDITRWSGKIIREDTIPVLTLDTILNLFGDREVALIKSDIEGSELEAFMYCNNLRKIKRMAIGAYHIRDGEPTYIKLLPFLKEKGYDAKYEDSVLYATRIE